MDVGAGCIPYSLNEHGELVFLFHAMSRVSIGKQSKKLGFYVDCGGGGKEGESLKVTAIREFNEETMWVYAEQMGFNSHEEAINNMKKLIENSKAIIYSSICWEYHCFLINLPFINPNILNEEFEKRRIEVNEKPRNFYWITKSELKQCLETKISSSSNIKPIYPRLNTKSLLEQIENISI